MKYILYTLLLTGLICSCDKKTEVAPQDEIIRIEFESDTSNLRADNTALIKLKAIIPQNAIAGARNINFLVSSVDAGTYQGTATSDKTVVPVGDEGIGRINFKVGTLPGNYFVTATVISNGITYKSRDYPISLREVPGTEKISLTADNMNPEADGYTIVNIKVKRSLILDKTATLTANTGSFIQASSNPKSVTLTFDPDGNATAQYQVGNQVIPHILTLTLANNYATTIVINPTPSYPENIVLETDKQEVDTVGGSVKLTVYLQKNNINKKVSKGTRTYYSAYQMLGSVSKAPVGRFTGLSDAVSNDEAKVTQVSFYADTKGLDPLKVIYIEASADSSATGRVIATQTIKIKK